MKGLLIATMWAVAALSRADEIEPAVNTSNIGPAGSYNHAAAPAHRGPGAAPTTPKPSTKAQCAG